VLDATGVLLPGDYDQDMDVNADDYQAWREVYGSTSSSVHDPPLSDGNFDNIVDAADYVLWRKIMSQPGAGNTADGTGSGVPEPAGAVLLVIGLGAMVPCRHAHR
jgi:hypothetical protein